MGDHVISATRTALLHEVAGAILTLAVRDVARVGIDGIDGSGKTTFADELAAVVAPNKPVIRASVDSFHNPSAVRYRRGRYSPEGFFQDSYDYNTLRTVLLDPLGPGGSRCFRRAAFDVERDLRVDSPEELAPEGAVLILDGIFLHRPELRDFWDLSVFLAVEWDKNHHITNFPEGWPADPADPRNRRYSEGQKLYIQECRPRDVATIVVNNENLAEPFLE